MSHAVGVGVGVGVGVVGVGVAVESARELESESKSESLESLESDAHVLALEKPESFNMGLTEPSESELDPFRSRSAPDEAPSI